MSNHPLTPMTADEKALVELVNLRIRLRKLAHSNEGSTCCAFLGEAWLKLGEVQESWSHQIANGESI